jgi:hypothetical protein
VPPDYASRHYLLVTFPYSRGLTTYKLTQKGTSHGKELAGQVWVSALRAERARKWVSPFSQETAAS